MNYLLAEIKERGRALKTYKIFSDEEVYTLPTDLDNPKCYNSDYKLEDDEWFCISNFSETDYCIGLLKRDFSPAEYNQISKVQLRHIKFLCSYQVHNGEGYYFFQKVSNSSIIEKTWFRLSDEPVLEKDVPILIINSVSDAIYQKSNDKLYFKKLTSISGIFKGVSELYKEATKEETEEFLSRDFIKLVEEYNAEKVGATNRKRIALAMDTLSSFTKPQKTQIFSYIKDYCPNLPFDIDDSNFSIANEEDLKHLLWGIEQRYYTTPIGQEKRIANSVSKVQER